jgi:DNA-binding transcriptional ArsR family regulator
MHELIFYHMVEYTVSLDNVFNALADPTRRDILRRVSSQQLTISQIAQRYNLSFAAVSKHLMVLEKAKLIIKQRVGRKRYVRAQAPALKEANDYLEWYKQLWSDRLDGLEIYLNESEE